MSMVLWTILIFIISLEDNFIAEQKKVSKKTVLQKAEPKIIFFNFILGLRVPFFFKNDKTAHCGLIDL